MLRELSLLILLFLMTFGVQGKTRTPQSGLLFFASFEERENDLVKTNPYIIGAVRTIKWCNIEKSDGVYDWSSVDQFIDSWVKAGKKVALRMQWSTSGYWQDPDSKTPTPSWVWGKGAKFAYHEPSQTEIPLFWDPIYLKYAYRFLKKMAERYDNNENILFVDITPGAETNPFRERTIHKKDPAFKDKFAALEASDGNIYSEEIWKQTVLNWIGTATKFFKSLPTEIALNKGTLYDNNNFELFGNYAVENGMYIGQNGLSANRYTDKESTKVQMLQQWSERTKIFFEMVASSGDETGTLQGVIDAARRGHCSYLNVYAKDVIAGTKGSATFDPEAEKALIFGVKNLK